MVSKAPLWASTLVVSYLPEGLGGLGGLGKYIRELEDPWDIVGCEFYS